MDKCRLCRQEQTLRLSHITPKMFFNQIKKTSPTKRFRNNMNPNRAVQDGEKHFFLCQECEEKFSRFETLFSSLYSKITESSGCCPVETDSDGIRYFLLSVAWRNLRVIQERGISDLTEQECEKIENTLEFWREILYKEDMKKISSVKQYVIPTAKLAYFEQFPRRVFDCVCPDFHVYGNVNSFKEAFIVVQVPYLIFVTMTWGELSDMSAFQVGNVIQAENTELSKELVWQLDEIHKEQFNKANEKISDRQKEEILKRALSALNKE